jgi:hypothetical protein
MALASGEATMYTVAVKGEGGVRRAAFVNVPQLDVGKAVELMEKRFGYGTECVVSRTPADWRLYEETSWPRNQQATAWNPTP